MTTQQDYPAPATNISPLTEQHVYVSNACTHAKHDRCNKDCHFCGTPCRCRCHADTVTERWGRPA